MKKTIRTLAAGEAIPTTPPRRYMVRGYVRLRWTVAPHHEVEVFEHRVFDGIVTDAENVHHINGIKHDNRPENLHRTSAAEHQHHHRVHDHDEIIAAYQSGKSTYEVAEHLGVHQMVVWSALKRAGIKTRTLSEALTLNDHDDRILALARQGKKAYAVSRELGVSKTVVYRVYHREGLL